MLTLLILEVPTLIGNNAQAIHFYASQVGASCAFSGSKSPQLHILADDALLAPVLWDLKRYGKVVFEGHVTPMEWAGI